jgi:hypothetical protein
LKKRVISFFEGRAAAVDMVKMKTKKQIIMEA